MEKKKQIASWVLWVSVIAAVGIAGCARKTTTYTLETEPVKVHYATTQ